MSRIDLDAPPSGHDFKVSVERTESGSERGVRLFKDVVLFLLAIGFIVVIAWLCVRTLTQATASPDEKKWAMSILSAATGGLIGYLVRK